jgi:hypothetical protein
VVALKKNGDVHSKTDLIINNLLVGGTVVAVVV